MSALSHPEGAGPPPAALDPESLSDLLAEASRQRQRREIKHGWLRHAGVCLGFSGVLEGMNRVWSPGRPWASALALAWGLLVVAHGLWAWWRLRRI